MGFASRRRQPKWRRSARLQTKGPQGQRPDHGSRRRRAPGLLEAWEHLLEGIAAFRAWLLTMTLDVALQGGPGPEVAHQLTERPREAHLEWRGAELRERHDDRAVARLDQAAFWIPVRRLVET